MGEKTYHNSDASGTRQNVKDVEIVGNVDMFQLLCKASSKKEGWMKSTKALQLPRDNGGCLVQVTTQQGEHVAEALVYVSNVRIVDDLDYPGGRKLVSV